MHPSVQRSVATAVLAVSYLATPGSAQRTGFAYAPGTYRYAVTTTVNRTQDQPADRPPFAFEVVTKEQVTVGLAAASADTLDLTIVVDSISVGSSLSAPAPNVDKLRGAKLSGKMSPTGRVYKFEAPANADPETAALYAAFRKFLLPLPNASVAVGSKWVDTSTDRVTKEGIDITTTTITTSRVAGDTTVDGHPAWRIERNAAIEAHGTGSEGGRPLRLRNDGTISGTHYVSSRGVYLGSTSTQRVELLLSASESDVAMPIVQTIKSSVLLLPQR